MDDIKNFAISCVYFEYRQSPRHDKCAEVFHRRFAGCPFAPARRKQVTAGAEGQSFFVTSKTVGTIMRTQRCKEINRKLDLNQLLGATYGLTRARPFECMFKLSLFTADIRSTRILLHSKYVSDLLRLSKSLFDTPS